MQFLMLMMPNIYRGNPPLDGFLPDPAKMAAMARFQEEMARHVKFLAMNGLRPLCTGARVAFGQGKPLVTDGPFIETKEVLGGYWLVEADSQDELVKWAQKCPCEAGDTIEIRQIFDCAELRTKK